MRCGLGEKPPRPCGELVGLVSVELLERCQFVDVLAFLAGAKRYCGVADECSEDESVLELLVAELGRP